MSEAPPAFKALAQDVHSVFRSLASVGVTSDTMHELDRIHRILAALPQAAPSSGKEMAEASPLDEKLIARLRGGQSLSALDYKRLLFLASQALIRRSPAPDGWNTIVGDDGLTAAERNGPKPAVPAHEIEAAVEREMLSVNSRVNAESAPSTAPAEDGWRDIESAPRDGTHVLACNWNPEFTFDQRPPTVIHWFDYEFKTAEGKTGDFYTSVNELEPEQPFPATHWRPLPLPPAQGETK